MKKNYKSKTNYYLNKFVFNWATIFVYFSLSVSAQVQTMYWIGGAGNWNDVSHWSFQSGAQEPLQPSSVPTADTHVIFDANSGLNGTGSTNPELAARIVTLGSEVVILSLTFDNSLASHSPRLENPYHIRVAEDVVLQPNIIFTNNNAGIVMEPVATKTATLTLNGAQLRYFTKGGSTEFPVKGTKLRSTDATVLDKVYIEQLRASEDIRRNSTIQNNFPKATLIIENIPTSIFVMVCGI